MARPSKYSPELAKAICSLIAGGCTHEGAALKAGIGPTTLYRWAAERSDFADALEDAAVLREAALIEKICGAEDWRGSAWYLERVHPERYGGRQSPDSPDAMTRPYKVLKDKTITDAERLFRLKCLFVQTAGAIQGILSNHKLLNAFFDEDWDQYQDPDVLPTLQRMRAMGAAPNTRRLSGGSNARACGDGPALPEPTADEEFSQ